MIELGRKLKETRETRGISLHQVQEATKISLRYLEAMENGEFDFISGEVYIRGFLRSYAQAVGLESDEAIKWYQQARNNAEPKPVSFTPQEEADVHRHSSRSRRPVGKSTPFLFGLLGLIAIFLVPFLRMSQPVKQGRMVPAATEPSGQDYGQNGSDRQEPQKMPAKKDPHRISIIVLNPCWVEVTVDGRVQYSGTLQVGEDPVWNGSRITLVLGNAGGVRIIENGEDQGIPGRSGQRIKLKFGG